MSVQPAGIKKSGTQALKISWTGGHESVYPFRLLRQNCQCALCVDEWSGKPLLARESVAQDLQGLAVNLVGQYALAIQFSDAHSTGIFTFKQLRALCPCEVCAAKIAPAEDKKFLDKSDLRTREA